MKKKLLVLAMATMLVATAFTGCGKKAQDTTTESVTTTDTQTEDITTYVKGIKDLTVEVGAKDVDYLKNVTYDEKYIKSVTVDSSDVKVKTVGKYKLVYTVTPVDTKTDIATVVKTVTVEVVTTDDAQAKADNGEVVITDNGETKKASGSSDTTAKSESTSEPTQPAKSDNSSSTEPAKTETAHTHNWVAVTETVTVTDSPATTRQELVSEAWDETVVDQEEWYDWVVVFNYDGYKPTSNADCSTHQIMLAEAGLDPSYHSEDVLCPAVTHTVHHDATYKTVDVPAVTHTEERVIGYKCSGCGATK